MSKKMLVDFGVGVLTVVVGMAVYKAVSPVWEKTALSAPASTEV